MASRTLISVEEYLRTSYRPDCDYVDGEVLERNMGEKKSHAKLQKAILLFLSAREKELGIWVIQEQRVQVSARRFRIPDVCVTLGEPNEEILRQPPFICIEVFSPEDRWPRIQQRIDDYLSMGVPYVWVLDPATKSAYSAIPAERTQQVTVGVLKTLNPSVELPLSEIFS
jgi:Uma2 family endonuclease